MLITSYNISSRSPLSRRVAATTTTTTTNKLPYVIGVCFGLGIFFSIIIAIYRKRRASQQRMMQTTGPPPIPTFYPRGNVRPYAPPQPQPWAPPNAPYYPPGQPRYPTTPNPRDRRVLTRDRRSKTSEIFEPSYPTPVVPPNVLPEWPLAASPPPPPQGAAGPGAIITQPLGAASPVTPVAPNPAFPGGFRIQQDVQPLGRTQSNTSRVSDHSGIEGRVQEPPPRDARSPEPLPPYTLEAEQR